MYSVIVEERDNSAPSETQLKQAMAECGGSDVTVDGNNSARTVGYTGEVNRTKYETTLQEVVPHAGSTSWNFLWAADAPAVAVDEAAKHDVPDPVQTTQLLSATSAASEKLVTIEIWSEDLEPFTRANYRLCFAKKVGDSDYNVVWQAYDRYLTLNKFSWTPQYELFGSNTFEDNATVIASTNKVWIGPGETAELNLSGVLGDPYIGGPATAISMQNDYGPIHPGVNQISGGTLGPPQSRPNYVAENPVVVGATALTPVDKVLVWFQQDIETSTMFSSPRSRSIEVDLTQEDSVCVIYSEGKWSTRS